MTVYTMSRQAIDTLVGIMIDHYKCRDGENNIEGVYLIYGQHSDAGVVIDHFANCPNAHEDPLFYFGVDKEDAELITRSVRVVRPHVDLVGCMHTHEARGDSGPSWDDIESAKAGVINATLSVYERSVSFYDDRGFIIKFKLDKGTLKTMSNEEVDSDTHIAQYPFPPTDQ